MRCAGPAPDQPCPWHRWRWQGYSPELARTVVTGVLRDAVNEYRDLVTENSESFGGTLGINSVLPVRVEGAIELPLDDVDGMHSGIIYELKPDHGTAREEVTAVNLSLITDAGPGRYTHDFTAPADRKRTPFYQLAATTPGFP
jgi:hypothetical protein